MSTFSKSRAFSIRGAKTVTNPANLSILPFNYLSLSKFNSISAPWLNTWTAYLSETEILHVLINTFKHSPCRAWSLLPTPLVTLWYLISGRKILINQGDAFQNIGKSFLSLAQWSAVFQMAPKLLNLTSPLSPRNRQFISDQTVQKKCCWFETLLWRYMNILRAYKQLYKYIRV